MTAERSGSDGNGNGRARTKCSRIASLTTFEQVSAT
jgi:hypothetical protein